MRGNPRPIPASGHPLPNNPLVGTSPQGPGVQGWSNTGDGVFGDGETGVAGRAPGAGIGVWGENTGNGYGVKGSTDSAYVLGDGGTAGVWGDNTGTGTGVKGTSAGGDAVLGYSKASNHAGVAAVNDSGGFGVWAKGTPAGRFEGKVEVTGRITSPVIDNIQSQINAIWQQLGSALASIDQNGIDLRNLQEKADAQQPVVTLSPAPVLERVQQAPPSGSNGFYLFGRNFLNNASVVVRVVSEAGAIQEQIDGNMTDSSGYLANILVTPLIPRGTPPHTAIFCRIGQAPIGLGLDWYDLE
jgi:hypothetical protein